MEDIYEELQAAFDFYNHELFQGMLPKCIITLQRNKNICGSFVKNRFVSSTKEKQFKHEISMNPEYFSVRPIEETLSTLVHEMCHLKVWEDTKKETRGYHGKEWVKIMENCGLIPSATGRPGGKQTGYQMDHYIDKNGKFIAATRRLCNDKFMLSWYDRFFNGQLKLCYVTSMDIPEEAKKEIIESAAEKVQTQTKLDTVTGRMEKHGGIRVKYSCGCSSVWGKKGLKMTCDLCGNPYTEQVK